MVKIAPGRWIGLAVSFHMAHRACRLLSLGGTKVPQKTHTLFAQENATVWIACVFSFLFFDFQYYYYYSVFIFTFARLSMLVNLHMTIIDGSWANTDILSHQWQQLHLMTQVNITHRSIVRSITLVSIAITSKNHKIHTTQIFFVTYAKFMNFAILLGEIVLFMQSSNPGCTMETRLV